MKMSSNTQFSPRNELVQSLYECILIGIEVQEGEVVITLDDRDWHILSLALAKKWLSSEALEEAVSDTFNLLGWEAFLRFKSIWKYRQEEVGARRIARHHIRCLSFTYTHSGIAEHWVKRMLMPEETLDDFAQLSDGLLEEALEKLRNYQKPAQMPHAGFKFCIDDANPKSLWEAIFEDSM